MFDCAHFNCRFSDIAPYENYLIQNTDNGNQLLAYKNE